MDNAEFSRQAANIKNGMRDRKKRKEFQEAAIVALERGGDNPMKLMPAKYKSLFKNAPTG
jgi:hypothetical protein